MSESLKKIDPAQVRSQLLSKPHDERSHWQATVEQAALEPYVAETVAEMVSQSLPQGFPIRLNPVDCEDFRITHGLATVTVSQGGELGIWPLKAPFSITAGGTLHNIPDMTLGLIDLSFSIHGGKKLKKLAQSLDVDQMAKDASKELLDTLYRVINRSLDLPPTHRLEPPAIILGHREATITLTAIRIR